LIVGGGNRLGAEVAGRLAGAGARIVLQTDADDGTSLTHLPGGGHRLAVADRSDTDAIIRLIGRPSTDDGLDALVVLPGNRGGRDGPAASGTSGASADWVDGLAEVLSSEVLAVAGAMHAAGRRFAESGTGGRIVVVVDDGGAVADPSSLVDELSAAALSVLADHVAIDTAGAGVGVITVALRPAVAPYESRSADRTRVLLVNGIVLALGSLLGSDGLEPVDGSVLRLSL
jgi:NAD(P)-dependent dehydrogenase (short-subunit alcohol dehydrogenase family)